MVVKYDSDTSITTSICPKQHITKQNSLLILIHEPIFPTREIFHHSTRSQKHTRFRNSESVLDQNVISLFLPTCCCRSETDCLHCWTAFITCNKLVTSSTNRFYILYLSNKLLQFASTTGNCSSTEHVFFWAGANQLQLSYKVSSGNPVK